MKTNPAILLSKISILTLIMVIAGTACTHREKSVNSAPIRFEKIIFTTPANKIAESIRLGHKELIPFFSVFNQEVIKIGPDTLPGYVSQLERFVGDSMIREVYEQVDRLSPDFSNSCGEIQEALNKWAALTGYSSPGYLVTYISGFNQSFLTLPGILGIGVDNYLGSGNQFYQALGIPAYLRKSMDPVYLTADAVRAWLYSEITPLSTEGGFLDRMIYEGKLYYIASKISSAYSEEQLFHYSKEQLRWCREQENSMWKYLAEQKILFSTDRLTIRKFMEEAPFTRDFGNDSPGKAGIWIGYRVVSSYVKATGIDIKGLLAITSAKEILSDSRYHP